MAENLGIKNFSNMELTKQGLNLLAKIQAGAVSLRITRAAIGSGYLQSGQSAQELTSLINQMPSRTSAEGGTSTIVDIVYNKAMGNGKAAMQIKVQNGDTDFYIREIGIMAQDPDIGEILYAYTSCGGDVNGVLKYDGKNRVEYYFNAVTEIGNASDVNVNITLPSELTKEELDAEIAERKTADLELERKKADVGHSHVSADIVDVDTAPTSGSDKLVTSGGVYGALSGKQAKVTGGAETITSSNLTANRALVSDASGKVAVSAVTSTELGYLDGVTSNVQTQLDGKQETLDYNASDFLGCIEEVSQLCFEFGEELNFTNYAPQVNGVDVAVNTPCSGTEYNTGRIWLDGSAIYRKDFVINIANNTALTNGYITLNDSVDELLFPYGVTVINYSVSSIDTEYDTVCTLRAYKGIYEFTFKKATDSSNVILVGFVEYVEGVPSSYTHTVN